MMRAASGNFFALVLPVALILAIAARDPSDSSSTLALAVLWVATGFGLMWRGRPLAAAHTSFKAIQGVALLLLLLMAAATLFSQSRFHSLHEFSSAALAPMFVLLLVPIVGGLSQLRRQEVLRSPFWLLVVIAAAVLAEMLVKRSRPFGPFLDPNLLGAMMNAGLLVGLARTMAGPTSRAEWSGLLVLALAQASTASRGADLALLVSIAVVLVATWPFRAVRKPALAVASLVLVAHAVVATLPFSLRGSGTFDLLSSPAQVMRSEGSATARAAIWSSTVDAISGESGWHGTGLGTYVLVYPRYRSPLDLSTTGERAHSDYLERWLEGGLALAVATLMFGLALPVWLVAGSWRLRTAVIVEPGGWAFRIAMACVALCLGLHAIVNFILPAPALALLFAIALGCAALPSAETVAPAPALLAARRGVAWGGLLVMPLILLPIAAGNWLMGAGGRVWQQRDPAAWLQMAEIGVAIQPSNARFREAVVETTMQIAVRPEAAALRESLLTMVRRDLDAWLAGNRCDSHAWESLARLARIDSEIAGISPLRAVQAARDCLPTSVALRGLLAEELERKGDASAAYAELRAGLPWAAIAHDGPGLKRWLAAGARLAPNLDEAEIWQNLDRQLERKRATRCPECKVVERSL